MDGTELGRRLRAERTTAGRTIASVAADAGLSVPYIANLENGRGNPTVAALQRLAEALGVHLDVGLATEPAPDPVEQSGAVRQFARTDRFRAEVTRLAGRLGVPETVARQRILAVFSAARAASNRPQSTLDLHRLLDALTLANLDD